MEDISEASVRDPTPQPSASHRTTPAPSGLHSNTTGVVEQEQAGEEVQQSMSRATRSVSKAAKAVTSTIKTSLRSSRKLSADAGEPHPIPADTVCSWMHDLMECRQGFA